jgi:hypothetical protein
MAYGNGWVIRRRVSHGILRYFSEFKVRLLLMQGVFPEKIERDIIAVVLACQIIGYIRLNWATRRFRGFAHDADWMHRLVSYCEQ